jgi:antitoxin HicB
MTMELRRWREGKVRPIPGNPPHDRLVSRVIFSSLKESLRRSLPRHRLPHLQRILGAQYAFLRHVGIYLVRCGFQIKTHNQTLGRGRAASRWSAPSPGSRTRWEERALSHRPQMSSGRLFLDRVARQQSPSPLHRHAQTTMRLFPVQAKQDISTLQGIGHFYFALTMSKFGHAGSSFLEEEGATAMKRVIAWQIQQAMQAQQKSKLALAREMHTSRTQVNRLLDPANTAISLDTIAKAASALGKRMSINLSDKNPALRRKNK